MNGDDTKEEEWRAGSRWVVFMVKAAIKAQPWVRRLNRHACVRAATGWARKRTGSAPRVRVFVCVQEGL
jgi:hypothetical protein